MKKSIAIILVLLSLAWAGSVFAAAAIGITEGAVGGGTDRETRQVLVKTLTFTFLADGSGNVTAKALSDTALNNLMGWYIYQVQTKPGSGAAAPTNGYGITLLDANGYDIAGTKLTSRSSTLVQTVNLGTAAAGYPIVKPGGFTVTIASNSVGAATGTIIMTFVK